MTQAQFGDDPKHSCAQTYEQANVDILHNTWKTYAGSVDGLAGCVCPEGAECRRHLSKLYQLYYTAFAAVELYWRDVRSRFYDDYKKAADARDFLKPRMDAKFKECADKCKDQ